MSLQVLPSCACDKERLPRSQVDKWDPCHEAQLCEIHLLKTFSCCRNTSIAKEYFLECFDKGCGSHSVLCKHDEEKMF